MLFRSRASRSRRGVVRPNTLGTPVRLWRAPEGVGAWRMVYFHSLLATLYSLLATLYSPLATPHSLLATGYSPLSTRHSLLATRYSPPPQYPLSISFNGSACWTISAGPLTVHGWLSSTEHKAALITRSSCRKIPCAALPSSDKKSLTEGISQACSYLKKIV